MLPETILIVDDEPEVRSSLRESLTSVGYDVDEASGGQEALALLERRAYPVVLTDLNMPGGLSGFDLIASVKARYPQTLCVIITAYASMETTLQAIKLGAYDFIEKPFRLAGLEAVLDRALDHARVLRQLAEHQHGLEARVAARDEELRAQHREALGLAELLLGAVGQTDEASMLAPFLEHLQHGVAPDGYALLRPEGTRWRVLAQAGARPWAPGAALPTPAEVPADREWTWPGGYPEGYLLPLRFREELLGALFLGFEARTAFRPEDATFALWRLQVEAALRAADALARARAAADGRA